MGQFSVNFPEMTNPMISILLATYNSEKYIKEQIDSILNQTYKKWVLFIRDDMSKDNTLNIIDEYVKNYPDKISLLDNNGEPKRAYLNFIELLKNVDSDYYMFCDHDDVWLPNKIELSMQRMKEVEKPGLPVIVHTDMKVVDQNLKVINNSFWGYSRLLPERTSFKEMVLCNSANGCTMLFNNKAKEVSLPNVAFAKMHDMLLNQSVAANGGIISPIYEPTVLYRQHTDNVVGAKRRDFSFYVQKASHLWGVLIDNYHDWKLSTYIQSYSLVSYFFVKFKIMFLKIKKYH